jgi:hypothetical protein
MSQVKFFCFGLLAWAIAVGFGLCSTVRIQGPVVPPVGSNVSVTQQYDAVNVTAAGASLGFAVAGGLCFLAVGMADRRGEHESSTSRP